MILGRGIDGMLGILEGFFVIVMLWMTGSMNPGSGCWDPAEVSIGSVADSSIGNVAIPAGFFGANLLFRPCSTKRIIDQTGKRRRRRWRRWRRWRRLRSPWQRLPW